MRVGEPQGTTSARQERAIVLCDKAVERVLGMYWDLKVDRLGFNVGLTHVPASILQGCVQPTKHKYLRFMISVYDPLCLLGPYTISSKLILQAIWRSGIGWDEPLRDEEDEAWHDRSLIRIKGRVTCVAGAEFNHTPIVLHGKHNTIRAIVRKLHCRWQYGNYETVVNELLQRYVVFGERPALKAVCNQCLICKVRRGRPQPPLMAALPDGRLAYQQRPFTHCGVEYFGPILVKIGRSRVKRWGVLFTCLATRAVHLEIACSLATSSMIMALQRMAARRGCPAVIYSDNGTNFRGACTELQTEVARLDRQRQKEYALKNGIRWVFNPPEAPHMGGSWERLVRSVKVTLHATLKDKVPSKEVLCTVLAEAEHVVNSRLLTHVSVHPGDGEALTPNYFLIGTASGSVKT
ncbi:uncharacterized protein LOC111643990 [Copidosoma floridanum]|uniref:uncharacterized protein LOC111643990 n=1 Tax=Copidosoma floridanum TaxID=29053 RepID=UPI000C6F4999|nr:uncharacterized protein LOC111643990 [Copidosoma floridanum]